MTAALSGSMGGIAWLNGSDIGRRDAGSRRFGGKLRGADGRFRYRVCVSIEFPMPNPCVIDGCLK